MVSISQIRLGFYHRADNALALYWVDKIRKFLNKKFSKVEIVDSNPDVLVALGGDGTVLEASKKFHYTSNPMILGLNLGNVGFLTSVRQSKDFLSALDKFFKGKHLVIERMMLTVSVLRNEKNVFSSEALNEVVIENPIGMVDMEVSIRGTIIRKLRGSGVLVSTATGSTAYNLSAHGPIVMPDIKCLIMTELMTHNVPSPSIVFKYNQEINFKIKNFRERKFISLGDGKIKADVILITDGGEPFPLKEQDIIVIKSSQHLIKFVEFEKNYFFKSVKEQFLIP